MSHFAHIVTYLLVMLCIANGQMIVNPYKVQAAAAGRASASDDFESYPADTILPNPPWVAALGICMIRVVNNNKCAQGNTSSYGMFASYYSTTTFTSNQQADVTLEFPTPSTDTSGFGPACRIQSGSADFYTAIYDHFQSKLYLRVVLAGTFSEIVTAITKTYAVGNKLGLFVTGAGSSTRLTVKEDTGSGWVDVTGMTNIDPGAGNYLDGGQPGVGGFGGNFTSASAWHASDQ